MRLRPLPEMLKTLFLLAGSALLAASVWIWVQDITIPRQEAEAREHGIPRGNLSDLYPRWLGARELLLRGRDPYGNDVTREIQEGYYGRPLDPNRPFDPKDQQAFAYPLYVVFILAPMIAMPFGIVQRIFLLLLIALTVASVPLWLQRNAVAHFPALATGLDHSGRGIFSGHSGIQAAAIDFVGGRVVSRLICIHCAAAACSGGDSASASQHQATTRRVGGLVAADLDFGQLARTSEIILERTPIDGDLDRQRRTAAAGLDSRVSRRNFVVLPIYGRRTVSAGRGIDSGWRTSGCGNPCDSADGLAMAAQA